MTRRSTSCIRDGAGGGRGDEAKELWQQVQEMQYDEGGYIVWANGEHRWTPLRTTMSRASTPNGWFNLGGYEYRNVWFDR